MGSPVSPIVANLYNEHFEREALQSTSNPPRYWYRFVDDTWSFNKVSINKDSWSTSIALIQQSSLGSQGNGGISFLNTLVTLEADNSLSISVLQAHPY